MRRRILALGLAATATAVATSFAEVTPTWAYFTDTGGVTGTSFSTYTVPAPVLTCTFSGGSATLTWPAVTGSPPPLSYTGATSGTITTSSTSGPTLSSGTWTYVVNWATNGSTNRNKSETITITANLTNSPTWVNTASKTVATGSNSSASSCV